MNREYGRQMLEAVTELTVTLKARQQTWLIDDQAAQARKQSAKPENEAPAE